MSKIWQCHWRFQTVLENWSKAHLWDQNGLWSVHLRSRALMFPNPHTSSGGMGPTAKAVYTKLASMVATKHKQSYSQTISWLQCRLSFSLLHSSIMCLRGSCSSAGNPQLTEATIDQVICDWIWHELTRTYKIFINFFIPLHCASLFIFISLQNVKVIGLFPLRKRKSLQGGKNQLPWW